NQCNMVLSTKGFGTEDTYYSLVSKLSLPPTKQFRILTLHDALPICRQTTSCAASTAGRGRCSRPRHCSSATGSDLPGAVPRPRADRKSTGLNTSHGSLAAAGLCSKK